MPGAVAGYGISPKGEIGSVHPSAGEPVTHAAAELLAAAIALTEPARWSLSIEEDGAPWQGPVTVTWDRNGRVVASERTDAAGRLPELSLDGGERYTLQAGGVRISLVAISGRRLERTLDLGRRLELSASPNEQAYHSRRFTVKLTARNTGTRALTATVHGEAAAAFDKGKDWAVELEPGESASIDWPLHAKAAGRPWAVRFTADCSDAAAELSGATLRPEPPPSAR